ISVRYRESRFDRRWGSPWRHELDGERRAARHRIPGCSEVGLLPRKRPPGSWCNGSGSWATPWKSPLPSRRPEPTSPAPRRSFSWEQGWRSAVPRAMRVAANMPARAGRMDEVFMHTPNENAPRWVGPGHVQVPDGPQADSASVDVREHHL